jgi:hypothetical protein
LPSPLSFCNRSLDLFLPTSLSWCTPLWFLPSFSPCASSGSLYGWEEKFLSSFILS